MKELNRATARKIAEQLRSAADIISKAADELLVLMEKETEEIKERKPEAKVNPKGIDMVALRELVGPLMKRGKAGQVREVLKKYNAESLPKIRPEDYGDVYSDLEDLADEA